MQFVDDPTRLLAALTPLRRRLLADLAEPASATESAARLGLSRQTANYHLRVLERAGLVELVELRQRRGCTERVLRASADAFVVDPSVMSRPTDAITSRDAYAAEHLVAVAGRTVRDVSRMRAAAGDQGKRLLTFTIETEVGFAAPAEVHEFTDALATAIAEVAQRFSTPAGRRYRVVVGGHPAGRPGEAGTSLAGVNAAAADFAESGDSPTSDQPLSREDRTT